MPDLIPEPTPLSGIYEIAHELDVGRETATEILRAGLLGEAFDVNGRLVAPSSGVADLARVPYFDPMAVPKALVIKAAPAVEVDDSDRDYKGWHEALPRDVQIEAIRGWWPVKNPKEEHGLPLVITIGGFVVGVWRIRDHESIDSYVCRFVITEVDKDEDDVRPFIGHRMKPERGGPISYMPKTR